MKSLLLIVFVVTFSLQNVCTASVTWLTPQPESIIVAKTKLESLGPLLLGLPYKVLTIGDAHQTYSVSPVEVSSSRFLSAAEPYALRFFVFHGDEIAGSIQLTSDGKKFQSLQRAGGFSAAILQSIPNFAPQGRDFEFRYLTIVAIKFQAIWLHSLSDDVIIPLAPTFDRWKSLHSYSEQQMLEILQPEATKQLKNNKP